MRDGEGETAKGHRILVSKASAWKPQSGDVISEILGFCAFPPTPHFSGATIHGRQAAGQPPKEEESGLSYLALFLSFPIGRAWAIMKGDQMG